MTDEHQVTKLISVTDSILKEPLAPCSDDLDRKVLQAKLNQLIKVY